MPYPAFKENFPIKNATPTDYTMKVKPGVGANIKFEQDHHNEVDNYESNEYPTDSDRNSIVPTNQNIENALAENSDSFVQRRVSVITTDMMYEDGKNQVKEQEPMIRKQLSKRMESMKSSIISQDSSEYMTEELNPQDRFAPMRQLSQPDMQNVYQKKLNRGHKKNVLTVDRVLPLPGEIGQYLSVRKPPDEEFFHMSLLSFKLNHPHMEKICSINPTKLLEKALYEKKLTFFQFGQFIEQECDKAYLNAKYRQRKKKKKTPKKLSKEQKRQRKRVKEHPDQMYGKVFDDEYDLDDSYFV